MMSRGARVFWHTEDGLKERFFDNFIAAKAFYQEIPPKYAKALWDARSERPEDFYAADSWAKWSAQFTHDIRQFAVLWHDGEVQETRLDNLAAALKYYHEIPLEYAKVLWVGAERDQFHAHSSWAHWKQNFANPIQP